MEHPEFVEKAKFIREDEEVDNDLWPRDIIEYNLTKSWQARVRKLRGIIDEDKIEKAISKGDIYSAMSNSVSFVYNSNGVIIYAIVSAELTKYGNYYPTSPRRRDYRFNAVTVWPYVYNRSDALDSGGWSIQDLAYIQTLCREESGESELSKHKAEGHL